MAKKNQLLKVLITVLLLIVIFIFYQYNRTAPIISLSVSMALCVIFPLYDIFSLWRVLLEHRVRGVLVALFLSVLLLQFIFTSVLRILNFYEETREE